MERETWRGEGGGFVPGAGLLSPYWLSSLARCPHSVSLRQAQGFALAPTPSRAAPDPPLPRKRGRGKVACIAAPTFPSRQRGKGREAGFIASTFLYPQRRGARGGSGEALACRRGDGVGAIGSCRWIGNMTAVAVPPSESG